jgi:hypothetical protein
MYNYSCNTANDIGSPISFGTGMNDEGGGNAIFLDRHDINCNNKGISRIRLNRNGSGQFQFEYNCNNIPNLGNCVQKTTQANEDGGGNSIYLDRHNVKCDDNQVLSRVHLKRPDANKIQYEYTCCSR